MSTGICDAIVIGGGINGLVASGYFARARKRVILLEAPAPFGGLHHHEELNGVPAPIATSSASALDPVVLRDLKLAGYGFRHAPRELPLVALSRGGEHLTISRSSGATAHAIAAHSSADAKAWAGFRRELFWLAEAARLRWWRDGPLPFRFRPVERRLDELARTGASAWLDRYFVSDFVKAALLFDSLQGGLSPLEPGSVLVLLRRASRRFAGSVGAVAYPTGGPAALVNALTAAARQSGAELRKQPCAERISVRPDGIFEVEAGHETLICRKLVLAVPHRQAIRMLEPCLLGVARTEAIECGLPAYGEASIGLAMRLLPPFIGRPVSLSSRFVVVENPGDILAAYFASCSGALPRKPVFEMLFPSAIDARAVRTDRHSVAITVKPVPLAPPQGWTVLRAELIARVAVAIESFAPGFSKEIVGAHICTPGDPAEKFGADYGGETVTVSGLTTPCAERVQTPVPGLMLCGASDEPAGNRAGRAGRIAAALALGKGAVR